MGGHEWVDEHGQLRDAIVDDEFDVVISLYTQPGHGPRKGIRHIVYKIPDGPLTPKQIDKIHQLAVWTGDRLRMGRKVLIRCHAGYNRSGLLAAQTLVETSHTPYQAIELVRRARTKWALNNELFVDYLVTGLDVAYLLTGLEAPI
jgi:protein-tyrosine phosphatase